MWWVTLAHSRSKYNRTHTRSSPNSERLEISKGDYCQGQGRGELKRRSSQKKRRAACCWHFFSCVHVESAVGTTVSLAWTLSPLFLSFILPNYNKVRLSVLNTLRMNERTIILRCFLLGLSPFRWGEATENDSPFWSGTKLKTWGPFQFTVSLP